MNKIFLVLLLQFMLISAYSQSEISKFEQKGTPWADLLMSTMTLDEKIGQLIMVTSYPAQGAGNERQVESWIKNQKIGGVLYLKTPPSLIARCTENYQQKSEIPLFIALDAENGLAFRLDSVVKYPYNIALGAISNDSLMYQMGREVGQQCKMLGINLNFAPVVDVNSNPKNPIINYRSFGENPENVARKSWLYAKGIQDEKVMVSAKHFPGHGDTNFDSHLTMPKVSKTYSELQHVDFVPFKYCIDNGINGVMTAHINMSGLEKSKRPATLSEYVMTSILKDSLGFDGLVFSDGMNMKGITKYYDEGTAAVEALKAGVDVIEFVLNPQKVIKSVKAAIERGALTIKDIDAKCRKVLVAKELAGLNRQSSQSFNRDGVNSKQFELTARRLYEKSLTTIKNDNDLLPLQHLDTLKIASISLGAKADNSFQNRLNSYLDIDDFQINTTSDLARVMHEVNAYNLIILSVHGTSLLPYKNYKVQDFQKEAVTEITDKFKTILVFFSNPYSINQFKDFDSAQSIIVTYGDYDIVEDLSAQLIFGGIGCDGKLPVAINDKYPAGTGIEFSSNGRFKYTIPEEVGFDSQQLITTVDSFANYGITDSIFPECQVLLAKNGKVFFHKQYGFYTYDSIAPLSKNSIYDWASLTKITGPLPLIMKMYEDSIIDIDAPFSHYWKGFDTDDKRDITWREILAHQAGLKAWIPFYAEVLDKNSSKRKQYIRTRPSAEYSNRVSSSLYVSKNYKYRMFNEVNSQEIQHRGTYRYSGLAFYLFPDLISQLTGEEYVSFLEDELYACLGAKTVKYNPYNYFRKDHFVPTEQDDFFRGELLQGFVHDEAAAMMGGVSGNAGLFGTTNDLAKIMQLYLNGGSYGDLHFLKPETLNEFTRIQYPDNDNRRGLGFDKPYIDNSEKELKDAYPATLVSPNSFGHSGYTGTFAWCDPENGLLFIFMSNRVCPTRENKKLFELNFRPELQQSIYKCAGSFSYKLHQE